MESRMTISRSTDSLVYGRKIQIFPSSATAFSRAPCPMLGPISHLLHISPAIYSEPRVRIMTRTRIFLAKSIRA